MKPPPLRRSVPFLWHTLQTRHKTTWYPDANAVVCDCGRVVWR